MKLIALTTSLLFSTHMFGQAPAQVPVSTQVSQSAMTHYQQAVQYRWNNWFGSNGGSGWNDANTLNSIEQQLLSQLEQQQQELNQFLHNSRLEQSFSRHNHIWRLPKTGQKDQTVSSGIAIAAGDSGVSTNTMKLAKQILQNQSLPILKATGWGTSNKARIVFYTSPNSYGKALLQAGVARNQIQSIVSETGGLTIGTDVWIPLYNLQDQSDVANVLTHELTHVIFNQQGIGDTLPTWVNEGTAWYNGLKAQAEVSQQNVDTETQAYNDQLQQVVAEGGQLLPLTASEDQILSANYNVEWEDYLAVQSLVQSYGWSTYEAFLHDSIASGVAQSFQKYFNQDITTFESQFLGTLGK